MGLLDKASGLSTPQHISGNGTEDKKKTDTWLGPTDMGIFESKSDVSGPGSPEKHTTEGPGYRRPDIHALLWNAEQIENDLQAPAEVFALAVREFQAKKAALLVLGYERNYFVPYSIKGYDETTEHRLRIPYSVIAESVPHAEGYSLLGDDGSGSFKRFFSNREFSLISKILLVPFRHNGDIIALLIITDCPILSETSLHSVDFQTLSHALGELIHHSRDITLDRLTLAAVRSRREILSSVQESIELGEAQKSSLIFFMISLENFLELLRKESELVESYRLREDALRIISSMMPDSVSIFSVNRHVLLIVMPGKFHVNIDLLVHQIKVGLRDLFKVPQGSIDLAEKSFVYPSDINTSQEIIERIFSYPGTE